MFVSITVGAHLLLLLLLVDSASATATAIGSYAAYHGLIAWGVLHPRSRLFGPNRSHLATSERIVALTFDDGPHPEITPRVLDLLAARRAHATFFLIGKAVRRHPQIVRRIVAEGHAVGNHSDGHSYGFWALPPRRLSHDVRAAQQAIETAAGARCKWFRPPVGLKNCFLHRVLRREQLALVSWRIRFLDGCTDRRRLSTRLRRRLAPGSILLLHDGHDRKPRGVPTVLESLPLVLDVLEEEGYRSVALR